MAGFRSAFLALTLLGALPASRGTAEMPQRGPATDNGARRVWFVTTSALDHKPPRFHVVAGHQTTGLTLSRRSLSEPVDVPADGVLRVLRQAQAEEGAAEPPQDMAAEVVIPPDVRKAIVVLTPSTKDEAAAAPPFGVTLADITRMRGGDWMFVNASKDEIGVQIDRDEFEVRQGEAKIHRTDPNHPVENGAEYRLSRVIDGQWKLIGASTVGINPQRMEVCLFGSDPESGRIEYFGLTIPVEP